MSSAVIGVKDKCGLIPSVEREDDEQSQRQGSSGAADDNNDEIVHHTDEEEEEEGLQLLLAGLSSEQMANVQWPEEDVGPNEPVRIGRPKSQSTMEAQRVDLSTSPSSVLPIEAQVIRSQAHSCCHESGLLIEPPVRIVSFGATRGNGLVTLRQFQKGSTIFTERALYAHSSHCPACWNCWRSLSSLSGIVTGSRILPHAHLWPISTTTSETPCDNCHAQFCSSQCQTQHFKVYGKCCRLRKCLEIVDKSLESKSTVQLAIVVFVAAVHHSRQSPSSLSSGESLGPILDHLCGSSHDVGPLELGTPAEIESIYSHLAQVLDLTLEEQTSLLLSQDRFATYMAIVARNSFEGYTQNPFDLYYARLPRSSRLDVLAQAFGETSVTREMDRAIQAKVVVPFVAIFALTARMNHSCDPNVEVVSKHYMDCHMDVIARRDLEPGEELVISYLPEMKCVMKRRRRLEARYLFQCDCPRCTREGGTSQER
jgi:hypothetical protein